MTVTQSSPRLVVYSLGNVARLSGLVGPQPSTTRYESRADYSRLRLSARPHRAGNPLRRPENHGSGLPSLHEAWGPQPHAVLLACAAVFVRPRRPAAKGFRRDGVEPPRRSPHNPGWNPVRPRHTRNRRARQPAHAGWPSPCVKRPRFSPHLGAERRRATAHNTRGRPPRARGHTWPERQSSDRYRRPRVLVARRQGRWKRGRFTPSAGQPGSKPDSRRPRNPAQARIPHRVCEIASNRESYLRSV